MAELKLKDAPVMRSQLEREVGDGYVVGVRNAFVYEPRTLHNPHGDVYIAHLTGKEVTESKWSPSWTNPFRTEEVPVREEDLRFDVRNIYLTNGEGTLDRIRIEIATRYNKVIENGVLSEWLGPLLAEYSSYERQIKGHD